MFAKGLHIASAMFKRNTRICGSECEFSIISALDGRTTRDMAMSAVVSGAVCGTDLLQMLYRL